MDATLLATTTKDFFTSLGVQVEALDILQGQRTVLSVTLSPADAAMCLGVDGENLRSITTLVRRLVEVKQGSQNVFVVDINQYLESKLELLRTEARRAAQRTRLLNQEVALPPMSSYERLVIHELFAEDPDITTESRGEGKTRHVVFTRRSPTQSK